MKVSPEKTRRFTLNVSVQSFNHVSTSMGRTIISKRAKNYHKSAMIRFGSKSQNFLQSVSYRDVVSSKNVFFELIFWKCPRGFPDHYPPFLQPFQLIRNPSGKITLDSQIDRIRCSQVLTAGVRFGINSSRGRKDVEL